jgi:acetyltransferase-like isoleucine patch superfamily enzyme
MSDPGTWKRLFALAKERPYSVRTALFALINGYGHKMYFFLTGKRIRIGKAFRVYGIFIVRGPGKIRIGDNCIIESKVFGKVSFNTTLPEAEIIIGDHTGFNGTAIQCYKKISIGNLSMVANAYIVDSQAHHLSADRRMQPLAEIPSAPVVIGENVWVSVGVMINRGVTIGNNSVIGAHSLVMHDVPADCLYAGSPAKFIKPIPPTCHEDKSQ